MGGTPFGQQGGTPSSRGGGYPHLADGGYPIWLIGGAPGYPPIETGLGNPPPPPPSGDRATERFTCHAAGGMPRVYAGGLSCSWIDITVALNTNQDRACQCVSTVFVEVPGVHCTI